MFICLLSHLDLSLIGLADVFSLDFRESPLGEPDSREGRQQGDVEQVEDHEGERDEEHELPNQAIFASHEVPAALFEGRRLLVSAKVSRRVKFVRSDILVQ